MLTWNMLSKLLIKKFFPGKIDPKDPQTRKRFGMLSGIVGIICNFLLSAAKIFTGIITSSIAISADGFNNLSDAVSSVVTLVCFKTSGNPADKKHPFGYGRVEYISGLIVSIAIIFMGIELTKSSIEDIINPEPVSSGIVPIIILVASMIIKLWLGYFNKKIGKIIDSTAMKATSIDSLGDAAITATILISTIINYFAGISIDAYLGIGVALFVIFTGISMIKETLGPLIGQSPDPKFVKEIFETAMQNPEVLGVHELIVHSYGPGMNFVSFHAEIKADRNIMDIHEEIDSLEKLIKEKFGCQAAIIHMDPIITDDEIVNKMREKILSNAKQLIDENSKVYDLRIIPGNTQRLVFGISVPYDVKKSDKEITDIISKSLSGKYECIIDVNRCYFD